MSGFWVDADFDYRHGDEPKLRRMVDESWRARALTAEAAVQRVREFKDGWNIPAWKDDVDIQHILRALEEALNNNKESTDDA